MTPTSPRTRDGYLSVLLPNLGGRCPSCRDHRIEFAMVQGTSSPDEPSTDFDHHVVLFPARFAIDLQTEPPLPGDSAAQEHVQGHHRRVRAQAIDQVAVLEVSGPLNEVVQELDRAVELALADEPRAVVCDLSAVHGEAVPEAVEVLASMGRHVRDWSGIPVAMACPDPRVREALRTHPLGRHLVLTRSLDLAVPAVLASPSVPVEYLRLAPHTTARRAAKNFVTQALLDWGLDGLVLAAGLVVSELVASATMNATSDINLSLAWDLEALRLTVRDSGPDLPAKPYSHLDPLGRRLSVVAVLSRAFGVLPTVDGGKVIWAVLNHARPSSTYDPTDLD